MTKNILSLLFIVLFKSAIGQIGGVGVYKFLEMPNSARVAALGGNLISISDGDLNLAFNNPALLDSVCDNNLTLNFTNYFAGIRYGYVSYAKHISKLGTFAAGIHYIDYGKFDRADELGYRNGTFTAADYAINLIYSRDIIDSTLRVGANLKPVISNLENYSSYGLACDVGLYYNNSKHLLTTALVIKNFGKQIKPYYGSHYEPLPFDIQLAVSKRLVHAPFRISLSLQHLQTWNLAHEYEKEEKSLDEEADTNEKSKIEKIGDELFRHTLIGLEFLPGKNFHVRVGFDPQRRKEMKIEGKPGFVGISWGFGVKISKFHISYARSSYHVVGGSNYFSISTNLNELSKMKVFRKNGS